MKPLIALILFFLGTVNGYTQISNVKEEFALPKSLKESSGAIMLNGMLITHNDSGGKNELYELDLNTKLVVRTITITNATNVDWEDIAQDNTHIYIGDFGNNNGSRTDLKIYKINKTDVLNNTSVTAEVINFSYANQTDFTSNPNNTLWDAEALISLNASKLVLISKNWVNGTSNAYVIPKTSGTYSVSPLSTALNSGGLITGATHNELSGKIYVTGYNLLQPFIWVCESFTGNNIFSGTNTKTALSSLAFEQVEGITHLSANNYLLTSESFSISTISDYAKLISFSTSDVTLSNLNLIEKKHDISLFPNPIKNVLVVKGKNIKNIEIFNTQSVLLLETETLRIDMSLFNSGMYLAKVNFKDEASVIKRVIKY